MVGITSDVAAVDGRERAQCMLAYADAVVRAGGVPILLVADESTAEAQLALCDAVVLTGGDDPRTEAFGVPTHVKATPLVPRRQAFELKVLEILGREPRPTLGVCLGMQMMALVAGGSLDQHMPDNRADAARHWGADHAVIPTGQGDRGGGEGRIPRLARGTVHSKHRQAVNDPGRLSVLAYSDDGVIEAIGEVDRRFYLGVQWHPERTSDEAVGLDLFRALISAARRS